MFQHMDAEWGKLNHIQKFNPHSTVTYATMYRPNSQTQHKKWLKFWNQTNLLWGYLSTELLVRNQHINVLNHNNYEPLKIVTFQILKQKICNESSTCYEPTCTTHFDLHVI